MSAECSAVNVPPGYKQTGVGIIPVDWNYYTFGYLYAEPSRNGIYKTSEYHGRGTRIVNMGEMFGFEFISDQEMTRVELTDRELAASNLQDGDLLFGRRSVVPAGAGKCSLVVSPIEPITFESSIIRVRLDKTKAFPPFYYYFFLSPTGRSTVGSIVTGTNVKGIRATELRELKVPVPTKTEQEAIAKALSDADALIESLEQLITKKRQIKQGTMQELLIGKKRLPGFGDGKGYKQTEVGSIPEDWNCLESSSVASYFGGNAFKSEDATTSGVSWLKIANVGKRKIEWAETSFLPLSYINEYKAYLLQAGDVVMALTRPILDGELKIARLTSCDVPCLLNQRVAKVIAKSNADLGFIYYILQTPHFVESMNEEMAGTDPPNIGSRSLGKILIPVPSTISEQEAIANVLFDMDSEITALEEKLTNARQLKQGMMQELLTGRIRLV